MGEVVLATQYVAALRARERYRSAIKALFPAREAGGAVFADDSAANPAAARIAKAAPRRGGRRGANRWIHSSRLFRQSERSAGNQRAWRVHAAGLLIGYQLMGRPFDEATLYRIAYAYEQAHNWHERQYLF